MNAPTLEDVFAVMSAVSFGNFTARVAVPSDPRVEDVATRLWIALNVLPAPMPDQLPYLRFSRTHTATRRFSRPCR